MSQKIINKVNAIMTRQAETNEASLIDKKLFNLSLKLSIDDWRNIRGKEYWDHMDNLRNDKWLISQYRKKEADNEGSGQGWFWWMLEIKKKEYTLTQVRKYLKNKR